MLAPCMLRASRTCWPIHDRRILIAQDDLRADATAIGRRATAHEDDRGRRGMELAARSVRVAPMSDAKGDRS
jgi:hypothetical protein